MAEGARNRLDLGNGSSEAAEGLLKCGGCLRWLGGLLLCSLVATSPAVGASPKVEDLIKDADAARGSVGQGLTWKIAMTTVADGKTQEVAYDVKVKGSYAKLEATAPANHLGEALLMRDDELFFHKPGVKRPMVISASQKLMGPAANGDIAATNYARDYVGTLVGDDKADGVDCYKLDLKAKPGRKPTYSALHYWISKADHLGVKTEFLTSSGAVFKIATYKYDNKLKVGGKDSKFVSQMLIKETLKPADSSTIKVAPPKLEALDDSIFDLHNFAK